MRSALVNLNADLVRENSKYIMRITGDTPEGKAQLDNFIDRSSQYPTIVTTSKLLTTGVDAKTCRLIVLDSNINSMTEFKQIIGRGTRLDPEFGKEYFTIMDFRNVSRLFADPEFDGDPEVIYEVPEDSELPDETNEPGGTSNTNTPSPTGLPGGNSDEDDYYAAPKKYRVNDVDVRISNERVYYYDVGGKLITENLIDYTKRNIRSEYATLEEFLRKWKSTEQKQSLLDELKKHGVLLEALFDEEPHLKNLDEFDLICHLAYDQKPLTKAERANNVKKRGYIYQYQDVARDVLELLLDKYQNEGVKEIDGTTVLELPEFQRFGSSLKIVKAFGGKKEYLDALKQLKDEIYIS